MIVVGTKVRWDETWGESKFPMLSSRLTGPVTFRGEVCKVVPAGEVVTLESMRGWLEEQGRWEGFVSPSVGIDWGSRQEESYVVLVPRTDEEGVSIFPVMYWPPANLLQVEEPPEQWKEAIRWQLEKIEKPTEEQLLVFHTTEPFSPEEVEHFLKYVSEKLGNTRLICLCGELKWEMLQPKDTDLLVVCKDFMAPEEQQKFEEKIHSYFPKLCVLFSRPGESLHVSKTAVQLLVNQGWTPPLQRVTPK